MSELATHAWRERMRLMAEAVGSQQKLAERAGVHLRSLSRWINGAASPSIEDAAAVCAAANRSVAWLIDGVEVQPIDEELLVEIVTLIEVEALRRGGRPAPDKYAALVVHIYNDEMRHAAEQRRADPGAIRRAFRLVS